LIKGIKEDLNKWKGGPYSQTKSLSISKIVDLPSLTCRFSEIPIKIPASYFVGVNKLNLNGKARLQISHGILMENRLKGMNLPHSGTY
jgi:hypothetical protein